MCELALVQHYKVMAPTDFHVTLTPHFVNSADADLSEERKTYVNWYGAIMSKYNIYTLFIEQH